MLVTARSFGFLPRQAMFFLGFDVENILGKRTKMKLFFLKGVSSALLGAMSDFPGHSCSVDGWLVMFGFAVHDDICF